MLPRPRLQEELAYHPPELKKVVSPAQKFLQAVMVAVVGTGLGIGVGVFLAGRTLPANASAAVTPAPSGGAPAATPTAPSQAKPTVEAKTQTAPVTQNSISKVAPVDASTAVSQVHPPRLVRASLTSLRTGVRRRHAVRHKTALAHIVLPKETAPALVEEAKLDIPDGRFRFTIEGDQTAVAYDAQSGVVSTDSTGMFVVETTPGEVTPARSQETPANVHYKCDQDANCSLIMANLVVPHARMQTVSHTADWTYVPVSTDGPGRSVSQAPVYFGNVSR
jgi:hypothetical protein